MADTRVQIAITANDQASGTMDKIQQRFAEMNRSTEQLSRKFTEMNSALSSLGGALSLGSVALLTKSFIDAGLQMEKLNKLFTAAAGSANLGAREFEYIKGVSEKMGLQLNVAAESYGKWMASVRNTTLEGEKGRKVFESVSGATTALGLSADEAKGVFLALSQMMSKGKIQAEELRGQLGERLPGAFKLTADAMGITTAELDKMLKDGKVVADEVLPKLAAQLDKVYGSAAAEGAKGAAAEINRFNNALTETKATAGAALIPVFTDIVKAMKPALEGLQMFIGGLQIMAVKAAATPDRIAAAWQVVKSGKGLFSNEGMAMYGQLTAGANTAEQEAIDDIMKKMTLQGSGYTAAELARQRGIKPMKLNDDKKVEDDTSLWSRAHEKYLAYLKAFSSKQAEIVKSAAEMELEINRQAYETGLIDQQRYLASKLSAREKELQDEIKLKLAEVQKYGKEVDKYKETNNDAKAAVAYHAALEKQAVAEKELIDLQSKLNLARKTGEFDAEMASYKEAERMNGLMSQLLELSGRYQDAAQARAAFEQQSPEYLRSSPAEQSARDELARITEAQARIRQQSAINNSNFALQDIRNNTVGPYDQEDPLKKLKTQYERETSALELHIQEMEALNQQQTQEYSNALEMRIALDEKYAADKDKIETTTRNNSIKTIGDSLSTVGNIMMQGNKDQFEAGKAMAIAGATIQMISAGMAAFAGITSSTGGWGMAAGIAQMAAVIAIGTAQIAQIASTQYQARALGGSVSGRNTYLVGERGPELFTPYTDGFITPNNKLGGQTVAPTIVYQISTGVTDTVRAEIMRMAPALTSHAVSAVQGAMRQGAFA